MCRLSLGKRASEDDGIFASLFLPPLSFFQLFVFSFHSTFFVVIFQHFALSIVSMTKSSVLSKLIVLVAEIELCVEDN